MTRARKEVSGALAAINDQLHNGWHLAIIEAEEQAQRITNMEQNVGTMRATIERVEAIMMHMAQSLRAQPQQQIAQQH